MTIPGRGSLDYSYLYPGKLFKTLLFSFETHLITFHSLKWLVASNKMKQIWLLHNCNSKSESEFLQRFEQSFLNILSDVFGHFHDYSSQYLTNVYIFPG